MLEPGKRKKMWKKSKQTASAGDHSTILQAGRDIYSNAPTELIDQIIEKEIDKLRKSRFFAEFDRNNSSLVLGTRLDEGNLSCGSAQLREQGLAWCARLLARSEEFEKAKKFFAIAKTLGDSQETKIAEAFIISQNEDKATALQILAGIDSDASRSAGLMIVAHHDGAEDAIKWLKKACYTVKDLDSDGKSVFLNYQLHLGSWNEAARTVDTFCEPDFKNTPILHHWTALTMLQPAVPADFRDVVLTHIPFDLEGFRLASDTGGMNARRAAHKHFKDAVEAAKQLSCAHAMRVVDMYALWLELCDPELFSEGKERLKMKLRDPGTWLGVIPFALQLGFTLDLDAVDKEIDRIITINGGMTMDTANARLSLALTKPSPEKGANYIARHYTQLVEHINPKLIQFYQVEMFSRAGQIEKAKEVLNQLVEQGISPEEERNLRLIIAKAEGDNPVEFRKTQYKKTGTLVDLINLVAELEELQLWNDLCEYGRLLFKETRSLKDAELLVKAFNETHRSEAMLEFLKGNQGLLSQSRNLRMFYAWGLYHEGAFLESREALTELLDDPENPNYRALKANLSISMGDWDSLSDYVEYEYQNREKRSAYELIRAGQLALYIGLSRARSLVFEAASKAGDDATMLAIAYFISTSAGWENDSQVYKWITKAARLSGDDGPLKRMSFKDILDQRPEWEQRQSETLQMLEQGKIPIFLAAQSLNLSLINFMTFPALSNLSESDPRRRSAIPAYSGKRVQLEFDFNGKVATLDATALLTLSHLKILDQTLDAFDTVYIPHSTLGWLFEELQKAAFHQPSRIVIARQVRDMLATDVLEKFYPSTVADSDLSAQVGEDLAALIAEAEKEGEGGATQHVVIRSAPVYRISSLMEEEADLSAHAAVLSSCLAVVDKLRQKAKITAEEVDRASAYLQMQEKPWPNQPEIADGATLYLDNLAVTYLLHLGLLEKLKAAGLRAVASPKAVSEANTLLSYNSISDEVKEIIERLRSSLNTRIESGHIRVGRRRNIEKAGDEAIPEHPTLGISSLTSHCNAAIVDDRSINQYANMHDGSSEISILCTLDLLDALAASNVISGNNWLEYRTRLRRAGYFFVPITKDELERCLRESTVADGNVVETAELKAIRESLLRVRMSDWLQLPNEAPWLDNTIKTFIHVLRNLWEDGADVAQASARSNWLAQHIEIRGWAHSLDPENADNIVRIGRGVFLLLLMTSLTGVQQSIMDAYWQWLEERILTPIKEQFPDLYVWLVEWHKDHIAEITKISLSEGG